VSTLAVLELVLTEEMDVSGSGVRVVSSPGVLKAEYSFIMIPGLVVVSTLAVLELVLTEERDVSGSGVRVVSSPGVLMVKPVR